MLFVLMVMGFMVMQPCGATEPSLNALTQKVQEEALAYKESITSLQTHAQKPCA